MNVNGCRRGVLNWFAPGARVVGERDREESPEDPDPGDGVACSPPAGVGDAGMFAFGAVWYGMSVGEMYLRALDGPGAAVTVLSDSSSMGVIGGGGESGGVGEETGLAVKGEAAKGDVEDSPWRGLRARCVRRERDEASPGDPTVLEYGITSPPAASRILPRSLPYGGGGASVPELGARPHFFTLASMKTKPDCPKLICTLQGPSAPMVGKRL